MQHLHDFKTHLTLEDKTKASVKDQPVHEQLWPRFPNPEPPPKKPNNPYNPLLKAFKKSKWRESFKALGVSLPTVAEDGTLEFVPERQKIKRGIYEKLSDFLDPQLRKYFLNEGPILGILQFKAKMSRGLKFKIESNYDSETDPPTLFIKGQAIHHQEMEDGIIEEYLKGLKRQEIQGYPPGQNPLLVLTIDAFERRFPLHFPKYLALMVQHDPKNILKIPPEYKDEVILLSGYSEEEGKSIEAAIDYGLI